MGAPPKRKSEIKNHPQIAQIHADLFYLRQSAKSADKKINLVRIVNRTTVGFGLRNFNRFPGN